jgi:REP element-mobilizing transposase RayT
VLVDGVDKRLKKIVVGVCCDRDVRIIEMEVMPDLVHLLVEAAPQFGIHRLVKLVKGRPSRAPGLNRGAAAVDKILMISFVLCCYGPRKDIA